MAEKSIKKNFVFNIVYQLFLLIVPLIVTPYISRVVGVDGVGEYSYANSIVAYFVLVAVLGTGIYGQRAIGYSQKDKEQRSKIFWEILIFRLVTTTVVLGGYAVYLFLLAPKSGFTIYLILSISIINVAIDISWFLQGMEEFAKMAMVSTVFRILSVACIFLFVKQSGDLWKYVFITVGFSFLCNFSLWVFLPKNLCRVRGIKPFKNIKGILQLFLPTIAMEIYLVLDKSMIGWLSGAEGYAENGYYEQADKIVKITLAAVTALGTVMIPRIAKKYKEGNFEQINQYIYKSYRYAWLMAIPIMFGLIAVSSVFVPVFFGEGYEKCVILIPILSSLTIFIGLSNVTGMQYFVPTGRQNVLTMTVIIGAVVNIVLNGIMIPFWASIGAAIASVIAELCVTLAGIIYVKKKRLYSLKPIVTSSWKYWLAGLLMFGAVFGIKLLLPVSTWALIVIVIIGIVTYFLFLLILRDQLLLDFLIKFIDAFKKFFGSKSVSAAEQTNDGDSTELSDALRTENNNCDKQNDGDDSDEI